MKLVPKRRRSARQRALKTAGKVAKKGAKVKLVKKAPKTAVAVWAGRRSGKALKAALLAVVGVVTLQAIRKKAGGSGDSDWEATDTYRSSPTPASSQQTGAPNEGATGRFEAAKPAESATPPHGDKLDEDSPGGP